MDTNTSQAGVSHAGVSRADGAVLPEISDAAALVEELTRVEKLRRAQAVLAHAETSQGLRAVARPDGAHLAGGPSADPHTTLRSPDSSGFQSLQDSQMTKGTRPVAPRAWVPLTRDDRPPLPVHAALAHIFPHGLARGAITTINDSTYTALTLIAQATTTGWVAIIGAPDINYVAAHDIGVNLHKLIVIPDPADHTAEVIATFIDALDLILLGPAIALTPAEQRNLNARARDRGTHIITQTPWPKAHVGLTATPGAWNGVNHGLGRLTQCTYTLTCTPKHGRPTRDTLTHHDGTPHTSPHAHAGSPSESLTDSLTTSPARTPAATLYALPVRKTG